MNILMLVTRRQKRGAEVSAANLSRQLMKHGHRIIWVGLYKPGKDVLELENAVNIDLKGTSFSFIGLRKCLHLAKLINEYNADIVQANGSDTLKYAVLARSFSRKSKLVYRNISLVSFWLRNSGLKRSLYKWFSGKADFVASVGVNSKNDFIETFNYKPSKITVINRGIPINSLDKKLSRQTVIAEFKLPENANILVWAGSLSSEKNPTFVVNVMQQLVRYDSNTYLIMAGRGPEEELIKEMIADVSMEKNILLAGYRNDLSVLFAAADMLLLSSQIEGVPGVVLEAAVQATPTIAVNVGGVNEAIRDDETGLLIKQHDATVFTEKIKELIENPVRRRRLGEKAQTMVKNEFDENIKVQEFIALYNKLLQKKK